MEQRLSDVSQWRENTQIPPFPVCSSYKLAKFSLHPTSRLVGAKIPARYLPAMSPLQQISFSWAMCCSHFPAPSLGFVEAPSFGAAAAGALVAFPPHHLEPSQCFSHNTESIHVASGFLFPRPLSSQWLSVSTFLCKIPMWWYLQEFFCTSLGINHIHL